jgi:hypothetical protein
VKNKEDVRAAAAFVRSLGHAMARRIGIPGRRIQYFDGAPHWLSSTAGGFTLSHGKALSRRVLHTSPARILRPREDGSFLVGIAVRVRRFELTLFPSFIGIVVKLQRPTEGRFIIEEPVGRLSQGRNGNSALYGRIFNWNEANIVEFVTSFRKG